MAGGINTYSYALNQPTKYTDPQGLLVGVDDLIVGGSVLAVGCAITPACRQAVGDAISGLGNLIFAKPFVNDPAADAEHDAYKQRSLQTPPPGDECETLRWLLKREQDVVQGMQAWDAKWIAGRHAEAIRQRMRGIDKLKKRIEDKCGKCD